MSEWLTAALAGLLAALSLLIGALIAWVVRVPPRIEATAWRLVLVF